MSRLIYAHDWDILGDLRLRRWPSPANEPRPIKVTVFSWKGSVVGASHFEFRAAEEENQWWSQQEDAWVRLSCDSSSRGCSISGSVFTEADAIRICEIFLEVIRGSDYRLDKSIRWEGPKPSWAQSPDPEDE